MASFDFVECTAKSYRFIWERREDVLRLSAMVLVIKILSFVSFVVFDVEQDVLRQGLFLLPSYFLEGWVIAHLMIMALHHDELKEDKKSDILPAPADLDRNIKASMIMYVLVKLMLSFVTGTTFNGMKMVPDTPPPEPTMQTFIMAVLLIIFAVWAFRFLWVYVPMVMGRSPLEFLAHFKSFLCSFSFLGVWLMCFVPLVLLLLMLSEVFGTISGAMGAGPESVIFESGLAIIQALIDYLMALVSSIGVAYGIYSVFKGDNKKTPIW